MYAPPKIHLQKIPSGYAGTLKTVEHIIDLIKQGAKNFHVRLTAIDILLERGVRPKDYLGEIKALLEWVQQNVRYTKDTFRVEVLHSARRMLELRAGRLRRHGHPAGGDAGGHWASGAAGAQRTRPTPARPL